uniref:Uncharacterized protein n=1 Tax=Rhizophora mucronata TaxID=61149 RepID=A0A2P2PLL6_RHIMU
MKNSLSLQEQKVIWYLRVEKNE